jgi:peptide/nickel transport system permease protein
MKSPETLIKDSTTNFKSFRWRDFKRNKPAYFSLYILGILIFIAIFSPIISNQQPLYLKYKGNTYFPALSFQNTYQIIDPKNGSIENLQLDVMDWKHIQCDHILFAPIPYSPGFKDYENTNYTSPFDKQDFINFRNETVSIPIRFRHWLGTNKTGEDVLSEIIYGARISIFIGIFSMIIASIIGLFLGSIAGYFGNNILKTSKGGFFTFIIGLFFAYYYAIQLRLFTLEDSIATSPISFCFQAFQSIIIFTFVLFIFNFIGRIIGKLPLLNKLIHIPVDTIVNKTIEILVSLPSILLIITIAAISKRSIINVTLIIGLTSWTFIARQVRSEILKIRELEYIAAARSMGFSSFRILFLHALPNAIAPALVTIAFGIAGAIITESSLSFLNIGVPLDSVSWGRLLAEGREQFSAWWLVIFPGICLFVTVTIFNLIGEGIQDAMAPKKA